MYNNILWSLDFTSIHCFVTHSHQPSHTMSECETGSDNELTGLGAKGAFYTNRLKIQSYYFLNLRGIMLLYQMHIWGNCASLGDTFLNQIFFFNDGIKEHTHLWPSLSLPFFNNKAKIFKLCESKAHHYRIHLIQLQVLYPHTYTSLFASLHRAEIWHLVVKKTYKPQTTPSLSVW